MDKSEKSHPRSRWVILFIAFLAAFAFLFSMQAMPPLMSAIMEEYRITHATASLLILVVALPAVFLSIPGGVFVDNYGVKKLGSIGLFLICDSPRAMSARTIRRHGSVVHGVSNDVETAISCSMERRVGTGYNICVRYKTNTLGSVNKR